MPNLIGRRYPKKKKTANPNHLKSHQKIFSPIGLKMAEIMGVKLVFDTQKTSFEKNAK
jgi:hypothetical protein